MDGARDSARRIGLEKGQVKSLLLDKHQISYIRVPARPHQVRIILRWRDGVLHVSAPTQVKDDVIEQTIRKHQSWVLSQQAAATTVYKRPIAAGDTVLIRGEAYTIATTASKRRSITLDPTAHSVIVPGHVNDWDLHRMTYRFLRSLAAERLREQVQVWEARSGLHPARVTIKEQARRWGSCSSRRNINLNWRLIGAPYEVASYVIVHELAHLEQMNHSPAFWAVVGRLQPNFETHRAWLRRHGERLYDLQEDGVLIRV